ncbi:MAG TPA: hypothetical protein VGN97_12365 [Mesorhizobium sp.]|jgi:hypothetical protein|nr:hypothetical protein [Mesorhizobium sp.]
MANAETSADLDRVLREAQTAAALPRNAERLLLEEQATAEAISRRDESMANIMRGRQLRSPYGPDARAEAAEQAAQAETESAERLDELNAVRLPIDPEGQAAPLADRSGNFAINSEVAGTGGVGIDSSNSTEAGEPAQTAEEAGVVSPMQQPAPTAAPAKITRGNQPVEPPADGASSAEIPENWQDLPWPERRSLAAQFATTPVKNSDDANAAIEAELKRREA